MAFCNVEQKCPTDCRKKSLTVRWEALERRGFRTQGLGKNGGIIQEFIQSPRIRKVRFL